MTSHSSHQFSRRDFLRSSLLSAAAVYLGGCSAKKTLVPAIASVATGSGGVQVNDIHSQLNATSVQRMESPASLDECRSMIRNARMAGKIISVAGGRHSMGGQQFAENSVLIDTRSLKRVLSFDRERGVIDVEAGIQWPELIGYLHQEQASQEKQWAIVQK